jgi:hypothetical protein
MVTKYPENDQSNKSTKSNNLNPRVSLTQNNSKENLLDAESISIGSDDQVTYLDDNETVERVTIAPSKNLTGGSKSQYRDSVFSEMMYSEMGDFDPNDVDDEDLESKGSVSYQSRLSLVPSANHSLKVGARASLKVTNSVSALNLKSDRNRRDTLQPHSSSHLKNSLTMRMNEVVPELNDEQLTDRTERENDGIEDEKSVMPSYLDCDSASVTISNSSMSQLASVKFGDSVKTDRNLENEVIDQEHILPLIIEELKQTMVKELELIPPVPSLTVEQEVGQIFELPICESAILVNKEVQSTVP